MSKDLPVLDAEGNWVGTCPKCGTNHNGGLPPGTFGGDLACLREQARPLGERAVAAIEAASDRIADLRDRALRRWWSDPQ